MKQAKFIFSRTFGLIKEIKEFWKREGVKKTLKKYRWKLVSMIFLYYLVRDVFLYLILPRFAFFFFQLAESSI